MEKKVFNIGIELDSDFVDCLNNLIDTYGPEMAKLNGFAHEQLNYTTFIDYFIDNSTVADASIDGNANVRSKDIVSLQNEMMKPHSKLLSFNKLYYEMRKKWGKQAANKWLTDEYTGVSYLHDAYSASFIPYCYAADVDRVAKEGLFFFHKGRHAPKHLVTFTDFVAETVSFGENRSSGAFGLPSYLVWSFYFWHKDVENGYYMISPEYYRDQEFQRIVYKLNQPYLRCGIQSAFTNFNIFDHPYFEALFGSVEFPDGTYAIDFEDDIIEYQKAFMKVVSDIRSHEMFTFPVLTYSLLRVNGKFVDEPFARWACEHNMKWADSNFYISDSVDSLSSCCRLRNAIKGDDTPYFNSIGGSALNVGSVKVNTINLARLAYASNGNPDKYLENVYNTTYDTLKLLDVQRHIIERNIEKGLLPNYTSGLVDLTKQYSTVGCVGGAEAIEHFKMTKEDEFGMFSYTEEGLRLYFNALDQIHKAIDIFKKNNSVEYMINVEQVPKNKRGDKVV